MDTTRATLSNSSYELLKIILDFISSVMWPVTVFVILFLFKQEIGKLLTRAKKVELPGGFSLETLEQDIQQARTLAVEVKTERKPEAQKFIDKIGTNYETEANKKMIELGLQPSPSGIDLSYYRKIAETDPRLALVGLRTDLEIMLKNLAKGFNVTLDYNEPTSKIISKLLAQSSITPTQYQFIMTLYRISNSAAHGATITEEQALEVLDIGEVLVKDYVAWLYWYHNMKKANH